MRISSFGLPWLVLLLSSTLILAACSGWLSGPTTPSLPSPTPTIPLPTPGASSSAIWCPAGTLQTAQTVGDHQPLTPRPALLTTLGNPPHYSQINISLLAGFTWHLHTFSVSPPANPIAGILHISARPPFYPYSQDDEVKLYSGTTPTILAQFRFGTSGSTVGVMSNAWLPNNYPNFVDFSYVFSPSQLSTISASGVLDVAVGDNTSVQLIQLLLCLPIPTPTPTMTPTATPTPKLALTAVPATVTGPTTALDTEPTPTPTPINKGTVVSGGLTPVPLPSPTPTVVKKPTVIADVTVVPIVTPTPTPLPTATVPPAPTATPLPTPTPLPTVAPTATPTPASGCDLVVDKAMQPTGQPGTYTVVISVHNAGSGPCPVGTQIIDSASPAGSMTFSGPLIFTPSGAAADWSCSGNTCTAVNPLPPGYGVNFSFTATVNQKPATNCARGIVPQNADVNAQNNLQCVTVQ
jgi:hypothetical protein